jgi:hypothetical protein
MRGINNSNNTTNNNTVVSQWNAVLKYTIHMPLPEHNADCKFQFCTANE